MNFGAGGMQQMMRQVNQMKARMQKMKAELAEQEFTAAAGGGAVSAVATGEQVLKSLSVSKDVLEAGDTEMLQDLVVTAANDALKQAKAKSDEVMQQAAGGMIPPGLL